MTEGNYSQISIQKRNLCGINLHRLRIESHLSLEALTQLLEKDISLSSQDLANIEAGLRPVYDSELAAFASYFHVPLEILLWGKEIPASKELPTRLYRALGEPGPQGS